MRSVCTSASKVCTLALAHAQHTIGAQVHGPLLGPTPRPTAGRGQGAVAGTFAGGRKKLDGRNPFGGSQRGNNTHINKQFQAGLRLEADLKQEDLDGCDVGGAPPVPAVLLQAVFMLRPPTSRAIIKAFASCVMQRHVANNDNSAISCFLNIPLALPLCRLSEAPAAARHFAVTSLPPSLLNILIFSKGPPMSSSVANPHPAPFFFEMSAWWRAL